MVKPGYKQTEVGVIPEEWEIRPLHTVTDKIGDVDHWMPESAPYGVPYIMTGNLNENGTINFDNTKLISKTDFLRLSKKIKTEFGDIIFARYASVGRVVYVDVNTDFVVSYACATIKPSSEVEGKYLFYALKNQSTVQQIENIINDGTQKNIGVKSLQNVWVIIPTKQEIKSIIDALSDVDQCLTIAEKELTKQKAIKQGAMQELLTGKKRLSGFIREWQHFIFGELFDFVPNNAFTRAQMSESGKVKNIHYGDILTKYGAYVNGSSDSIPYISKEVDLARFAERCYLQSGDIIMADTAEDETVGKVLEVVNVDCPILAGQHTLLCRPKVTFAPKFLGYYLNSACYHDQLIPYIVGTKVSSVGKASVAQTELVVPDYEEQQAIAEILSNIDSEIDALERKLAKYRQVKQGMMQQLLTGKIRLTKNEEGLE